LQHFKALPARPDSEAVQPQRGLTGRSAAIAAVRDAIERAGPSSATVLITGETGTGKERVATLLHGASPRRARSMVRVNCAALPEALLESELFGHERGAFTGAGQRRIGRFEEANGGTLFLDEIGDMHPHTQAKVLRALQEREFARLGGTGSIRVDVRVVAATNQDLRALIAGGKFREDLLYRLDVVSVHLPPLRERLEDLPELAAEILGELEREAGSHELSGDALARLGSHSWPGNVRELRNVLERAALLAGPRIRGGDLRLSPNPTAIATSRGGPSGLVYLPPGGADHREVERELIVIALERTGWVQKDAASLLRMTRRRLNYRIRRLGIAHPSWRANRVPPSAGAARTPADSDLS
jgi:transcriptional regulator with GAF, ATPase, and Fis domain